MKLEIISLFDKNVLDSLLRIEPPGVTRNWMSNTQDKYAYRCLPLNIANQYGWAVYLQDSVEATWNGDTELNLDSIKITQKAGGLAASHFGHGILTFSIPFLVRLTRGYNLYITGAPNHHMNYVQPCSGIYEADWAPYSFTMNWRFTTPNKTAIFTPNDPICFIFPVEQNIIENTDVIISNIHEQDYEFKESYMQFTSNRHENLDNGKEFEKNYFQGKYPSGDGCPYTHKTKIKHKEFKSS